MKTPWNIVDFGERVSAGGDTFVIVTLQHRRWPATMQVPLVVYPQRKEVPCAQP